MLRKSFVYYLAFFLPAVFFISMTPKISKVIVWNEEISKGLAALNLTAIDDERFLGPDKRGFEELKKLIVRKTGFDEKNNFPVRGITHKGLKHNAATSLVFFCLKAEGGDNYQMISTMSDIKKWAREETFKRLF